MANHDSSSKAIPAAILGKNPVPCHRYDDWLIAAASTNPHAQFASAALDISRGAEAITSILTTHIIDLQAIHGGCKTSRTLLSARDTEALARLAVLSLNMLHEMAVEQVDQFNAADGEEATA